MQILSNTIYIIEHEKLIIVSLEFCNIYLMKSKFN